MKKPEIENWGYDGIVISPQGGKVFNNEEIIEAYSEMIDALIDANDYIIENAPDDIYPKELLDKLEQTLEKAGVEL